MAHVKKFESFNQITTNDDTRDIAIRIVDKLVEKGLVKDTLDTDDEDEFIVQDLIHEELNKHLGVKKIDENKRNETLNSFRKGNIYSYTKHIEPFIEERSWEEEEYGQYLIGQNFLVLKNPDNDFVVSFVLSSDQNYECVYSDI